MAGKEKQRNKEKKTCFRRELSRSHRKRTYNSKPAALNRNLHVFPGWFPQPGSQREGDDGVTTLSIFILLWPNTERTFQRLLKITSKQLKGRGRKVIVSL